MYPESLVLKNPGNTQDENELKLMEADYTSLRISEAVFKGMYGSSRSL